MRREQTRERLSAKILENSLYYLLYANIEWKKTDATGFCGNSLCTKFVE